MLIDIGKNKKWNKQKKKMQKRSGLNSFKCKSVHKKQKTKEIQTWSEQHEFFLNNTIWLFWVSSTLIYQI